MNEIYLFGDSASQGIVLDENGQYRVSRQGCIRLLNNDLDTLKANYAFVGMKVVVLKDE